MKLPKKPFYLKEVVLKYKLKRVDGKIIGRTMTDARTVAKLFSDLQNETKEKFITVNVDAKSKIISFEVVALGALSTVLFKPGEAFRTSLMVNAYGVIVIHNHPSGDPEPSKDDRAVTNKLKKIADLMGLAFHDHVIIGSDGYYSFAEKGLI